MSKEHIEQGAREAAKLREERHKSELQAVRDAAEVKYRRLHLEMSQIEETGHTLRQDLAVEKSKVKLLEGMAEAEKQRMYRAGIVVLYWQAAFLMALISLAVAILYFTTTPAQPEPGTPVLIHTAHPPHLGYMDSTGTFHDIYDGTKLSRVTRWEAIK